MASYMSAGHFSSSGLCDGSKSLIDIQRPANNLFGSKANEKPSQAVMLDWNNYGRH
jgi:hypothetical protein